MARNASLALSFRKIASRCSQGRNWRELKVFCACGALSFTISFYNFASGCSEKQSTKKKQNRSSSALSAQTFPVCPKNFALAALFWPFPKKTRRARSVATRSALFLPLLAEKTFGACGALSFTISFCNFASGRREKQTKQSQLGEERLRAMLRVLCCLAKSLLAAARGEIGAG